jgi:hypothetical protein
MSNGIGWMEQNKIYGKYSEYDSQYEYEKWRIRFVVWTREMVKTIRDMGNNNLEI